MCAFLAGLIASVFICLMNVFLVWWLARTQRTTSALETLFEKDYMREAMHVGPNQDVNLEDPEGDRLYREVLHPAACAVERFAALVNRKRRMDLRPTAYSIHLVERMAAQTLVSMWDCVGMQKVIMYGKETSTDPDTTYIEFEKLVCRLRKSLPNNTVVPTETKDTGGMMDPDLMIALLKEMEDDPDRQVVADWTTGMTDDERKRRHHVELLTDAGLAKWLPSGRSMDSIARITYDGHEFLKAVTNEHSGSRNWKKFVGLLDRGIPLVKAVKDVVVLAGGT